jgi:hypothetical protein
MNLKNILTLKGQSSFCWVLGGEREGAEWVVKEGVEAGGRNEPSLVCMYE